MELNQCFHFYPSCFKHNYLFLHKYLCHVDFCINCCNPNFLNLCLKVKYFQFDTALINTNHAEMRAVRRSKILDVYCPLAVIVKSIKHFGNDTRKRGLTLAYAPTSACLPSRIVTFMLLPHSPTECICSLI